ncbi:hypothetical protein H0H92_015838 [Tricholoma furcatifolium]|nr:hypothetical protein H0H92_015838 [Tricholoma furcatifolium]
MMQDRIKSWNESLHTQTSEFGLSSGKATVFLFSVHLMLTDDLDDPLEYDFTEDDPVDERGDLGR